MNYATKSPTIFQSNIKCNNSKVKAYALTGLFVMHQSDT